MFSKVIGCTLALCLSAWAALPVFADEESSFSVSSAETDGGEFTVRIEAINCEELSAFRIRLEYDSNAFELLEAEDADFEGMVFGKTDKSPFVMLWLDGTGMHSIDEGVVAKLTFACKDGAKAGSYDLRLAYDESDVIDLNGNDLDFKLNDGTVTIKGEGEAAVTTKATTTAGKNTTTQADTTAESGQGKSTTTKKSSESGGDSSSKGNDSSSKQEVVTTVNADESSTKSSDDTSSDVSSGGGKEENDSKANSQAELSSEQSSLTEDTVSDIEVIFSAADSSSQSSDSEASSEDNKSVIPAVIAFCALIAFVAAFGFIVYKKKHK